MIWLLPITIAIAFVLLVVYAQWRSTRRAPSEHDLTRSGDAKHSAQELAAHHTAQAHHIDTNPPGGA